MPKQKLLPQAIRRQIPPLYSQEHVADPIVYVKYFTPDSNWTWYATECESDEKDVRFFGLVRGFDEELGYFLLSDLQSRIKGRMPIERDEYFTPKPLSQARKE